MHFLSVLYCLILEAEGAISQTALLKKAQSPSECSIFWFWNIGYSTQIIIWTLCRWSGCLYPLRSDLFLNKLLSFLSQTENTSLLFQCKIWTSKLVNNWEVFRNSRKKLWSSFWIHSSIFVEIRISIMDQTLIPRRQVPFKNTVLMWKHWKRNLSQSKSQSQGKARMG